MCCRKKWPQIPARLSDRNKNLTFWNTTEQTRKTSESKDIKTETGYTLISKTEAHKATYNKRQEHPTTAHSKKQHHETYS